MICFVISLMIGDVICDDMFCYATHMSSYITHDMSCYITHVMFCYITHDMLLSNT